MRFLVQRAARASVAVDGETVSSFEGPGLLVFCGVAPEDTPVQAEKLCSKLLKLRIFEDASGAMNRSVVDVGGSIIVVSQFTLYADLSHGNRPGFSTAARPETAEPLYLECVKTLRAALGAERVGTGRFGASMQVSLLNDGPCTFMLECENPGGGK